MALPTILLPTSSVEVGGQAVAFRSLSRSEATHLERFRDHPADAEPYMIACALDMDEGEATAWLAATPLEAAGILIDAIVELSALGNGTGPKG